MSTPTIAPGATSPEQHSFSFRRDYLGDIYLYDWNQFYWRVPAMCMVAIALCLAVGIAAGHPAAGMIAASGAMTVGFGAMQSIDGSRFVPMIGASIGMALSTLIGMVAGHESYFLVATCAVWGFGYGLLTTRAAGVSWVGQQCVVTLLVASSFPFGLRAAAVRASLVLAGGAIQILLTSIQLRVLRGLHKDLYAFLRHSIAEKTAFREAMGQSFRRLLGDGAPPNPVFAFGIRVAVVLALSTEIYHRLQVHSGYWIPMTALLVLKPAFNETVKRALARITGTLAGAVLTSYLVAHWQPTPIMLAILVVVFAFLSYSMLNVNYAFFTLFLTAYIVFLLALANLPGTEIAHRRAFSTVVGGILALSVHLDAIRRWRKRATRPPLAAVSNVV
jgi:MFS family permease